MKCMKKADRQEMTVGDKERLSVEQMELVCANCKLTYVTESEIDQMDGDVGRELVTLMGEAVVKCFNNRVKYMASKARPKRVSLKTLETGETVFFLCKQASSGRRLPPAKVGEPSKTFSFTKNLLERRKCGINKFVLAVRSS